MSHDTFLRFPEDDPETGEPVANAVGVPCFIGADGKACAEITSADEYTWTDVPELLQKDKPKPADRLEQTRSLPQCRTLRKSMVTDP